MAQIHDPVKLRQRVTKSGRVSLYLDIYVKGKRSYEFLNLYLEPEVSRSAKERNRETLQMAEAIRAKRIVEVRNNRWGFDDGGKGRNVLFLDYYEKCLKEKEGNGDTGGGNMRSVLEHLKRYCKKNTTLADLDDDWARGWKRYLDTTTTLRHEAYAKPLSQLTKRGYMMYVRIVINKAIAENLIQRNPLKYVDTFKAGDPEKAYLTLEELKQLAATAPPKGKEWIREPFLFSCTTGIRKVDIKSLRWGQVKKQGEFTRIIFRQQKTHHQEYYDISEQAVRYMGERKADGELVFPNFHYSSYSNDVLREWAESAGINKHISFHSGRHTFAVMMLELGADIYTIQKLLGHSTIQMTMVYAKMLDKTKQEAVRLIPKIEEGD